MDMRILAFIFAMMVVSACNNKTGSGNIVSEKRNTGSFDGVRVGGGFEVEITKGDIHSVTIVADDNLIRNIETKVDNGMLIINSRHNNVRNANLKAIIVTPELNHIDASASAEVDVKGSFSSPREVRYEASSAADIKADINSPAVITNASSGGEITLTGRTRSFKGSASSGGDIDAKNLLSENSSVNASSGATIKVFASVQLDASASSGANIIYKGGGNVKKSVSSGGSVTISE